MLTNVRIYDILISYFGYTNGGITYRTIYASQILFASGCDFDSTTKTDMMETVVLEQYMRVLYPEIRTWVKERNPMMAAEAANLVEDYIAARKGFSGVFRYAGSLQSSRGKSGGLGNSAYFGPLTQVLKPSHSKPVPPVVPRQPAAKREVVCDNCAESGHISSHCPILKPKSASLCYLPTPLMTAMVSKEPTVSVLLNGKPVTALVDTGCAQTLVKEQYVPRKLWTGGTVSVCCVHGDKSELPTAEVYIEVNKQPYLMKVGIASTLPYVIVLGTDMPILADLVQETAWCCVVTRAQAQKLTDCSRSQNSAQLSLHEMPFLSDEIIADVKLSVDERLQNRRD